MTTRETKITHKNLRRHLAIALMRGDTSIPGVEKAKHPHNVIQRMTRAWAENLAGQWLREKNYEI